jgi:hypothetical protein
VAFSSIMLLMLAIRLRDGWFRVTEPESHD